jgi:hypothetical protein
MKRKHLFELHDYDWFPGFWRDMITDVLSDFEVENEMYAPVARLLASLVKSEDEFAIVDLCSGAGLPIVTTLGAMDEDVASNVRVTLTDKFPNIPAFERVSEESGGRIGFSPQPVDATDVPESLTGFRTCFTAFHHFRRQQALAILKDTVDKRQGIGIFEYTERRIIKHFYYGILFQAWLLLSTLFGKPRERQTIFWTCIVPVVPLVFCWDAVVSCLRTYSVAELEELVGELGDCAHTWEVGTLKTRRPFRVTYLIGYPREEAYGRA